MQSGLLLGDLRDQMYHCIHLVEIPQWESGRDRKHPWRTIQHLVQLRSHPRGTIHFRYYDVTSCDVTFGHVTSSSQMQWYIWSLKSPNRRPLCIYPGLWLALYRGCINLLFCPFFLFTLLSFLFFSYHMIKKWQHKFLYNVRRFHGIF
jgi:hypothetical protein